MAFIFKSPETIFGRQQDRKKKKIMGIKETETRERLLTKVTREVFLKEG